MTSGVVPKYEEQALKEEKFLKFLHLLQSTAGRDADYVSRAWAILLIDKTEKAIRRGCGIDDVLDALDRCCPSDTRVVSTDPLPDEKTPLARPSRGRRT